MDRASPSLSRLFEVAEVCWEDADTVVYGGRGFGMDDRALLRAPKSGTPDRMVLDRLARHFAVASKLPESCAVRPVAMRRFGVAEGVLFKDTGARPIRIEARGPRERVRRSLGLALAALDALTTLHAHGVVHRRITPANLWIEPRGGATSLFDLSEATFRAEVGAAWPAAGDDPARRYAAPELLCLSPGTGDPRSDFFSLGAVLYEWLTGRPPFGGADRPAAPVPPVALDPAVPPPLSALLLRLLAQDPADRYQDAASLRAGLAACLDAVDSAIVGAAHAPPGGQPAAAFDFNPRLCGREAEHEALLRCFGRARHGSAELALVSGPPGIGKTALVTHFRASVEEAGGLFASGKFDQVARNTPYASIAQAFARLVSKVLAEPEERFAAWKTRLAAALGVNGRIVADLIPEIELVLGPQPAVQQLPPNEARNRFHLVLRGLFRAFASRERPLCVLLDDMQWIDPASLDLLRMLLTDPEVAHTLLIGTYRDNEVGAEHPLTTVLDALRRTGRRTTAVRIGGLPEVQVQDVVADALERTGAEVRELSALLHRKSGGNPFVLGQLLGHLHEAGLIHYDRGLGEWCWSMREIWDHDPTEDVVELLREKLRALPAATRSGLMTAACLGSAFDAGRLAMALGTTADAVLRQLRGAIDQGLLVAVEPSERRAGATHRFLHDRVQQAAFSLFRAEELPALRLQLGRRLLAALPAEEVQAFPFEVVDNLNSGAALVTSPEERLTAAGLNLAAGRLSRAALAYREAAVYLRAGLAMLDGAAWRTHYRLAFDLHAESFQCEYQTSNFDLADRLFALLMREAGSAVDKAAVYHTKIQLDISLERYADAMRMGQEALSVLGTPFPRHARKHHVLLELLKARMLTLRRSPSALQDLPPMEDPARIAAARILLALSPAAYFLNPGALMLIGMRIVTMSMRFGNSSSSAGGYVLYGLALGAALRDIAAGQQFGALSVALARRFDDIAVRCRVLVIHGGFVNIWSRPFSDSVAVLREAYATALDAGDFAYANYALLQMIFLPFASGSPLPSVLEECERSRGFIAKTQDRFAIDNHANWVQAALALQGRTQAPTGLSSEGFDEAEAERRYRGGSNLTTLGYFLVRKLHLACVFGDHPAALRYGKEAERFFGLLPGQVLLAEHALYFGLTLVEVGRRGRGARLRTAGRLARCRRRLGLWAFHAPENFRPMRLLLEAECASARRPVSRALALFDEAIGRARDGGFHNVEALAAERASLCCLREGHSRAARAYLEEAIAAYRAWGATAKVERLERFAAEETRRLGAARVPGAAGSAAPERGEAASGADAHAAARTAGAAEGEMALDEVLRTFALEALRRSGARKGAVVLREGGRLLVRMAAEGSTATAAVETLDGGDLASEAIVNYVVRSGVEVALDDALSDERFSSCRHVRGGRLRSVLCLPLQRQGRPIGALYLEGGAAGPSGTALGELRELCADTASAVERARMELNLRRSRKLLHHATRTAEIADRVRLHLEKFVPTAVQRLIEKNPSAPDLKPADRDVSVMFLDIEGYAALSERYDRAALGPLVEQHFSRHLTEIHKNGGDVNQTAGDGLMVIFQEPAHHAAQAVRTALAVQSATDEINLARGAGLPEIKVHIGINSGVASVGATMIEGAATALWVYTAVGPTVNLAARIAGSAEGGEILIGRATADRVAGLFTLQRLGPRAFKNIGCATEVFRVVGKGASSDEAVWRRPSRCA